MKEEQLGRAPMLSLVLKMALPAMAAQFINLLYSIVDRVFIGHIPDIGTNALAGIGITGSVIILITAFSSVVGIGGAPLAAIAMGEGNRLKADSILGNGVALLVIFSLLTAFVTYIYIEPILIFTGASPSTLPYAQEYLSIYLIGTLFVLITTGLNSFISAQGYPSVAMWVVVLGAVINISLDYIFIFVLDIGVAGAAWATVIAQAGSAAYTILFLTSSKASLKLSWRNIIPRFKVLAPILALGLSPFVMSSTEAIVGFVLNGSLVVYGDVHISAMAVIQSALLFVGIPLTGFAQGFMPIVSYNYGQGNISRVRSCFKIALIFMTSFNFVLILSMIIFPEVVASIFTQDQALIDTVSVVMPVFFLGSIFFGLQRTFQCMFISLGQAKISIFIAVLRKLILLIPLALYLPRFWGVMGVYRAESISDFIAATTCTVIFYLVFPRILRRRVRELS